MSAPQWASLASVIALVALGLVLVVWLIRSKRQDRRRARAIAQLAAKYRRTQPKTTWPDEPVTVAELVERNLAEGRAVRLNWEEDEPSTPDTSDWPAAVLPRVPRHDPYGQCLVDAVARDKFLRPVELAEHDTYAWCPSTASCRRPTAGKEVLSGVSIASDCVTPHSQEAGNRGAAAVLDRHH